MKNIKITINITTYLFFLISFFCGFFRETISIFFIVFVHEFGHVLAVKFFSYKLLKVEFYPFGGITKIDKPINSSLNKELVISVAGVLMQIILFFVFIICKGYIEHYEMLQTYNLTILFFNLLPIIPLDGSVFFHALLEKKFSYEKAFSYYKKISLLGLFLFLIYNIYFHIDNYYICLVLFSEFILLKKEEKYLIKRFYLERYLNKYPYKKIQNECFKNIHSLRKETLHFFLEDDRYIHEKEVLKSYFDT